MDYLKENIKNKDNEIYHIMILTKIFELFKSFFL